MQPARACAQNVRPGPSHRQSTDPGRTVPLHRLADGFQGTQIKRDANGVDVLSLGWRIEVTKQHRLVARGFMDGVVAVYLEPNVHGNCVGSGRGEPSSGARFQYAAG